MSDLVSELTEAVRKTETEGSPSDLVEAGEILRSFLRRNPVLTRGREDQGDALLAAIQSRDWAVVETLLRSPFEDIARQARIFIYRRDYESF